MNTRYSNPRAGLVCLAALLTSCLLSSPADAAQGTFELYSGGYRSDSPLDDEPTFGLRGSYRFSDRWGLEATLGRAGLIDFAFTVDTNARFAELSALWYATPGRRAEVFFFGGLGVTSFDDEIRILRQDPDLGFRRYESISSTSEELATFHAGVGVFFTLVKGLYLRPDLRTRWLDNFADSDIDLEASVALGWRFGKR